MASLSIKCNHPRCFLGTRWEFRCSPTTHPSHKTQIILSQSPCPPSNTDVHNWQDLQKGNKKKIVSEPDAKEIIPPYPVPTTPHPVGFIYLAMTLASWAHQLRGYSLLASKVMAHTCCTDLAGLLYYHIFFNYIAQFHMFLFWRDSGSSLKRKQGFQVGSC